MTSRLFVYDFTPRICAYLEWLITDQLYSRYILPTLLVTCLLVGIMSMSGQVTWSRECNVESKGCKLFVIAGAESNTIQQAGALQDRGMLQPSASPSLRVTADGGDVLLSGDAASSSIVACGVTAHTIETLPPRGTTHLTLSFLPLALGVQQLR